MIPKTSFNRINCVSTHSLPPQENIAAASFVDQMPLPLGSDEDVFFDAEEEPEISQEEADKLDAEADALDEEIETSLDHPFVKAIINILVVPAIPITAGMRIATYLATYHPRSLRVGLALMEAANITTTSLKAWQDVKSAKKSIDLEKEQQEKNRHKRSLDDPQKNATTSSSPSFSEDLKWHS